MRSSTRASSLARVNFMLRCFGPFWSAVMKGRLTSVWVVLDNSILAFSAASLLGCILEAVQRQAGLAEIDAGLLAELVRQGVHDPVVEILAAEEGVAVGGLDLEHAVTDLEDGNAQGAPPEVVDRDLA